MSYLDDVLGISENPASSPNPASQTNPGNAGGAGWYGSGGGWMPLTSDDDELDKDKNSGDFFTPSSLQIGNNVPRQGGSDGFSSNPNANGPSLPPGPGGIPPNVRSGPPGSNSGNDNDYTLDNQKPLGISMDTGTVAGKFSPSLPDSNRFLPTGGGWIYYDPAGNDSMGGSDKAFPKQPFQLGQNVPAQGVGDGSLSNPKEQFLPPASVPYASLQNVPDAVLGSNRGNDHDYTLDNPKPLGISMDTATDKNISPLDPMKDNFLTLQSRTPSGDNASVHQGSADLTNAIAGSPFPPVETSVPGDKSGRFLAAMPYIFKWENTYDKRGNVIAEHDPDDPGGVTKYGIDKTSHHGVDVENLTKEQATEIYWKEWQKSGAESMPYPLGEVYFQALVNGGGDDLLARSGGRSAGDPNRFLIEQKARYQEKVEKKKINAKFLPGLLHRADDAWNYFLINH